MKPVYASDLQVEEDVVLENIKCQASNLLLSNKLEGELTLQSSSHTDKKDSAPSDANDGIGSFHSYEVHSEEATPKQATTYEAPLQHSKIL